MAIFFLAYVIGYPALQLFRLWRFVGGEMGISTHDTQLRPRALDARRREPARGPDPLRRLILCADKGEALVRYATDNLPNKVVVRQYLTALPAEKLLAAEIAATRKRLERRR